MVQPFTEKTPAHTIAQEPLSEQRQSDQSIVIVAARRLLRISPYPWTFRRCTPGSQVVEFQALIPGDGVIATYYPFTRLITFAFMSGLQARIEFTAPLEPDSTGTS